MTFHFQFLDKYFGRNRVKKIFFYKRPRVKRRVNTAGVKTCPFRYILVNCGWLIHSTVNLEVCGSNLGKKIFLKKKGFI